MEAVDAAAIRVRGLGGYAGSEPRCRAAGPSSAARLSHLGPGTSRRPRRRGLAQDRRGGRHVPRISRRAGLCLQRPPPHRARRFPAPRRRTPIRAGGLMVDRTSPEFRSYVELYDRASLLELGRLADEVRWKLHPENVVTYIIDRNINYTNVCVADCKFCAFYRRPKHPEGYLLSYEEIGRKIDELKAIGGVQILMQGGHNPYIPFEWYLDLRRGEAVNVDGVVTLVVSRSAAVHQASPRHPHSRLLPVGDRFLRRPFRHDYRRGHPRADGRRPRLDSEWRRRDSGPKRPG